MMYVVTSSELTCDDPLLVEVMATPSSPDPPAALLNILPLSEQQVPAEKVLTGGGGTATTATRRLLGTTGMRTARNQ
jgi:hypothetical protein